MYLEAKVRCRTIWCLKLLSVVFAISEVPYIHAVKIFVEQGSELDCLLHIWTSSQLQSFGGGLTKNL